MGRTLKHSWVMGTATGTWLGLVRCPKYSIRSGKGRDFEEEKRVSKGQTVILAWRLILLLLSMANLHFLRSCVRESIVFVFRGQA